MQVKSAYILIFRMLSLLGQSEAGIRGVSILWE